MLVAPAGYGKTTLAAQWAERDRRPFAWLSLDESDDDAHLLLARLAGALDCLRSDDERPVTVARPKDWSTELVRLSRRLSSLGDFVLVLDNAQAVQLAQLDEGPLDAGRARPAGIGADTGGTPRAVVADRAPSRGREVARAARR